jgi:hypothetical protein
LSNTDLHRKRECRIEQRLGPLLAPGELAGEKLTQRQTSAAFSLRTPGDNQNQFIFSLFSYSVSMTYRITENPAERNA